MNYVLPNLIVVLSVADHLFHNYFLFSLKQGGQNVCVKNRQEQQTEAQEWWQQTSSLSENAEWKRLKRNFWWQVREKIARNNGRVGASESAPRMITLAKSLSFYFLQKHHIFMCALLRHRLRRLHIHPFHCDSISRSLTKQLKTSCRCALHVCGWVFRRWRLLQQISAIFLQFFYFLISPSINRHHVWWVWTNAVQSFE